MKLILNFFLLFLSILSSSVVLSQQTPTCFNGNSLLTGFTADYLTFAINMSTLQSDGSIAQASFGSEGYISVDFQNQLMVKVGVITFNINNKVKFSEFTFGSNSTQYILINGVCYINKFDFKFPSSLQVSSTSPTKTTMGANIEVNSYNLIDPNPLSVTEQILGVDDGCNFIMSGSLRNDGYGFSSTNFYYYYPNTHNPEMFTCLNPKPFNSVTQFYV